MAKAICYRLFSLWDGVFILTPSASGPLFISRSSHLPLSTHEDRVSMLALGQHMYGERQSSGKAIFCSLSSRKHCQFPVQEHRAEPELCLQGKGTEDCCPGWTWQPGCRANTSSPSPPALSEQPELSPQPRNWLLEGRHRCISHSAKVMCNSTRR